MFEAQFNQVFGNESTKPSRTKKRQRSKPKNTYFYCNECEDVTDHAKDGQCKECHQYNPEAMNY